MIRINMKLSDENISDLLDILGDILMQKYYYERTGHEVEVIVRQKRKRKEG